MILCLIIISAVGCKGGVGNITGDITYGEIIDNETKEVAKSKETTTDQNGEAGEIITTSAVNEI